MLRFTVLIRSCAEEPIPTTTASDSIEQNRHIDSLLPLLKSCTIDVVGLQQLSAISKARAVRQEDENSDDDSPLPSTEDSEAGVQTTREFWGGGKRFGELFAGLRELLLKESQVCTSLCCCRHCTDRRESRSRRREKRR